MQFTELRRELLAEFLGTLTLMIFGLAVNAQVTLSSQATGTYLSINFGWGLAVMMGIYVSGGISGAHLNPAVTIALACLRGFSWRKVIPYILVQLLAAIVASTIVFFVYYDALGAYEANLLSSNEAVQTLGTSHLMETAGIWATYPQEYLTLRGGFVDQAVGTALLLMLIFAMSDGQNLAPYPKIAPITVGTIVFLIGMTFGLNCGYAINPIRDFGPRIFTYVAGWGGEVFQKGNGFWWVPIAGPIVGAVIGGFTYDLFVKNRHPEESE